MLKQHIYIYIYPAHRFAAMCILMFDPSLFEIDYSFTGTRVSSRAEPDTWFAIQTWVIYLHILASCEHPGTLLVRPIRTDLCLRWLTPEQSLNPLTFFAPGQWRPRTLCRDRFRGQKWASCGFILDMAMAGNWTWMECWRYNILRSVDNSLDP